MYGSEWRELARLIRSILEEIKMSQVQLTVTFNIAPAVQPLAETTTAVTVNGTSGVALSGNSGDVISGGVPPYTVTVDAASPSQLPPGVTASVDGSGNVVFSGTPTTAGTGTVLLDITDAA